jgi:hypothetical protein
LAAVAGPVAQTLAAVAGPFAQTPAAVAGPVAQTLAAVAGPFAQTFAAVAGPVAQTLATVAGPFAKTPAACASPFVQVGMIGHIAGGEQLTAIGSAIAGAAVKMPSPKSPPAIIVVRIIFVPFLCFPLGYWQQTSVDAKRTRSRASRLSEWRVSRIELH